MKYEVAVQGGSRTRTFVGENDSNAKIIFNYTTPANKLTYSISL